jgi:hypothetical protein
VHSPVGAEHFQREAHRLKAHCARGQFTFVRSSPWVASFRGIILGIIARLRHNVLRSIAFAFLFFDCNVHVVLAQGDATVELSVRSF